MDTYVDVSPRTSRIMPSYCDSCDVRALAVCAAMKPIELIELESILHHVSVQPKTTFIEEGEPADRVYTLNEGSARIYKLLSDGRRQIVGFALPGDFVGLMPRDTFAFSADALDHLRLCRFERDEFDRLARHRPRLMERLHQYATDELLMAQQHMSVLGRRTAEERIATFLVDLRRRWARVSGRSVTIPLPMSRLDIADYLGLTIETVSRTLTRMARERVLLMVPDGVRVLDDARLVAMKGD
jgi:CRP/FNR family transcriptional regulator, anaerobic regulatory protein